MITDEWINGTLPIYGYFYMQYLFSSALIMVISSQLYGNQKDFVAFETALEILQILSGHGNLAATEFYDNLECVRQCLGAECQVEAGDDLSGNVPQARQNKRNSTITGNNTSDENRGTLDYPHSSLAGNTTPEIFANETALQGQNMEQFLGLPDVEFRTMLHSEPRANGPGLVESWPDFSLWTV